MPRVALVSYATENFKAVREDLNESALQFGISDIFSYDQNDLHRSTYYERNKVILDEICGAGYWAWKPHFILEALNRLEEGDILFYCDAGSLFVKSPAPLIELCHKIPLGLMLFDAQPLLNRQFTKRDCFVRMGCDEAIYWNATEVIATILVLRKCAFLINFLKEWLHYCQDRAAISDDPNISGKSDLPGIPSTSVGPGYPFCLGRKAQYRYLSQPNSLGKFPQNARISSSGRTGNFTL